MPERRVAHVYVDGFNMYYGALRGHTGRKWLDLATWSETVLPQYEVRRIVYCTARSRGRANDPGLHERQDRYLRALKADGRVEILEGQFKSNPVKAFRSPRGTCEACSVPTHECGCGNRFVEVMKSEEKGSDVNLAVELVKDAYSNRPDVALVVSGDSDLQRAVDIARSVGVRVLIADPRNRNWALHGDESRRVSGQVIERCQFPDDVTLPNGTIVRKPALW